jgi:hypothetical protein
MYEGLQSAQQGKHDSHGCCPQICRSPRAGDDRGQQHREQCQFAWPEAAGLRVGYIRKVSDYGYGQGKEGSQQEPLPLEPQQEEQDTARQQRPGDQLLQTKGPVAQTYLDHTEGVIC